MKLSKFNIKNFKSLEDLTIHFNSDLNVLTGANNSGKTTILEAIALWNECFDNLINQAKKRVNGRYDAGDFIFGPSTNKYFDFTEINSVRSPSFEDIFRDRHTQHLIVLTATLSDGSNALDIPFTIKAATGKYVIELQNAGSFDYKKMNSLLKALPYAIDTYYASPVAFIEQSESFATPPQIRIAIKERNSAAVIRNRLYRLYESSSTGAFERFQNDLSYVLFNNTIARLEFSKDSDIQKDAKVIINYKIDQKWPPKDISLLGSGSLQCIEILLNFYQQSDQKKDLKFILLDEPDSHIHRDIQKRLLEILLRFSSDNQVFITTHNEALIRSTPLPKLFHIDGIPKGEIKSVYEKGLAKLQLPHFKGLYPSQLSPIIKSIGYDTGLDFLNAIEADRIVFVEGEDDARVIHRLLQEYPGNSGRKIMYWVLGGVSAVFSKLPAYRYFFKEIKNGKSLWEKSYLAIDKDALTDEHAKQIKEKIAAEFLPIYMASAYTIESVLWSEPHKLGKMLTKYMVNVKGMPLSSLGGLEQYLSEAYTKMAAILSLRYMNVDGHVKPYIGQYVEKTKELFDQKKPLIENDEIKLLRLLEKYYKDIIDSGQFYKLMNKSDVELAINDALAHFGLRISIENDFYDIVNQIDKSTWFNEWDALKDV